VGEQASPATVGRLRPRAPPPDRSPDCGEYTTMDVSRSIFNWVRQGGEAGKMSKRKAADLAGIPWSSWYRALQGVKLRGEFKLMEQRAAELRVGELEAEQEKEAAEPPAAQKKRGRPSADELAQRPYKDTGVPKATYKEALQFAVRLFLGLTGLPTTLTAQEAADEAFDTYGATIRISTIYESAKKTHGEQPRDVGRPPALPPDVEKKLVESIEVQRSNNWPVWQDVIIYRMNVWIMNDPALRKELPNGVGKQWMRGFLARHADRLKVSDRLGLYSFRVPVSASFVSFPLEAVLWGNIALPGWCLFVTVFAGWIRRILGIEAGGMGHFGESRNLC